MEQQSLTNIYYYIPQDSDDSECPNVFIVPLKLEEVPQKVDEEEDFFGSFNDNQDQQQNANYVLFETILGLISKQLIQNNKEIENSIFNCFLDLNNSNSYIDKKIKSNLFQDSHHESIYDSFFEFLQPQNEKNCFKFLIFFTVIIFQIKKIIIFKNIQKKFSKTLFKLQKQTSFILNFLKKLIEKQAFSQNSLDILYIIFLTKLNYLFFSNQQQE
ncbi:hypothetical protein IMG5_099800, partial [Ichthyophthirius multifiliis]